jgi:hypothetical protein
VLSHRFKNFDVDSSGTIDFDEFVKGTYDLMRSDTETLARYAKHDLVSPVSASAGRAAPQAEEGEDEEEAEMPDDLTDLSPEEQQYRVKVRAAYLMAVGTSLVLLFSDPMVDVLNEIGVRVVRPARLG